MIPIQNVNIQPTGNPQVDAANAVSQSIINGLVRNVNNRLLELERKIKELEGKVE